MWYQLIWRLYFKGGYWILTTLLLALAIGTQAHVYKSGYTASAGAWVTASLLWALNALWYYEQWRSLAPAVKEEIEAENKKAE